MRPFWTWSPARGAGRWIALGWLAVTPVLGAQDTWQRRANRGPAPQIGSRTSDRAVIAIDTTTRRAIDRGLEYLRRTQNPDGSWTDKVGRKVHNTYRGMTAPHVGVTALAGLAFLASGSLPGQGPQEKHCAAVHKALDFVIDQTQDHGFISANGSRMYSHAFATLFLAEAYGTGLYPNPDKLQDRLKRAVRLIVNSQNQLGGWRYLPLAPDADMSITVCQVMALRAARNAGITVPRETIARAVNYVTASFTPTTGSGGGAFYYQISPDDPELQHRYSFALTACGVTTLYGAGEYNSSQVRQGLLYLWHNCPPREYARNRFDYYYGHYYAIQAAFQAGGDYWVRWYEDVKNDLLALQESDGSWTELVGPNYATAMAAIILQMPNQYLPITES